jgi:hypothetical protein
MRRVPLDFLPQQLAGHDVLKSLGISTIPHRPPTSSSRTRPPQSWVRQVPGAIAQFEKASNVAKLAAARKRKRECEGRCEGATQQDAARGCRPSSQATPSQAQGGQLSLRAVASELAARGKKR